VSDHERVATIGGENRQISDHDASLASDPNYDDIVNVTAGNKCKPF